MSLAAVPHCAGDLAVLIARAWPDYYGPAGPGDAAATVAARSGPGSVPCGVVALDAAGRPVGTAGVELTSHGMAPDEAPWLVGLYVMPEHRGHGVATALVAALEDAVAACSAGMLHCCTIEAAGILRMRGWRYLRHVPDEAYQIWRKPLSGQEKPPRAVAAEA